MSAQAKVNGQAKVIRHAHLKTSVVAAVGALALGLALPAAAGAVAAGAAAMSAAAVPLPPGAVALTPPAVPGVAPVPGAEAALAQPSQSPPPCDTRATTARMPMAVASVGSTALAAAIAGRCLATPNLANRAWGTRA